MASITKTTRGWRVQLSIKGVRESITCATKAQALAWAAERETALRNQVVSGIVAGKTFEQACRRYEQEVSIHKRGHRWEALRLAALCDFQVDGVRLGSVPLTQMHAELIGRWRDLRLKGTPTVPPVSGATINRILNLWSHVLSTAATEWKWLAVSPTAAVRRPQAAAHRDRRPTQDEIDRINVYCGFYDEPITSKMQAVAFCYLFAIETAMRQGELCGLYPSHINGAVAHLPMTKNGSKRDVPLSKRALELISFLPAQPANEPPSPIFMLSAASLSTLFRKVCAACCIEDLTFHDSRHEAITRLAKKLTVLDLARMVGHKDLRMLQIYYNETAAEMATRLD
ncbi:MULTISPECIES: site-specific integrase [unclassified Undibacterium]|uniref:tyrosine-type recombinase/integrase n=1 Tax=unclassified Undibacterium TaxID=2630295 RepID=UPI002AC8D221|nr:MULTISPECIES: site-specific integrase [unclassified Undibacterium]MEB0138825.1 site-specific integrase [Undibacterium sp. CCC2.1]MEB0170699.1 site-specific integrase [Undibacterium sp. CCC1.1]MEB0177040.1 site-specific integrase [Undibacterium sp. CCC3.4]MEB0216329.1 site-specific integrase [Undibacterium sp. 5I2]WPX42513.1 site-specific integrase [Undibacterium sp. CCC3.4]